MNDKIVYLDSNNNVICWGDSYGCNNYLKQFYSLSIDNLHCEEYDLDSRYSYFYEGYEVVQIRGTDIFLTLGLVDLMRNAYTEELRGINLIKQELHKLCKMDDVLDYDMIDNLVNIEKYMDEVYRAYTKYNSKNLFENLDFDTLHQMYQYERENKGLPTVYLR